MKTKIYMFLAVFFAMVLLVHIISCSKKRVPAEGITYDIPPTLTATCTITMTPKNTNTVTQTVTNTSTVTPTFTITQTWTAQPTVFYDFETDQTADWAGTGSASVPPAWDNSGSGYNSSTGCLSLTGVNFNGGAACGIVRYTFSPSTDFRGRTIVFHVKPSANLVDAAPDNFGVQIYLQDNLWAWDDLWINIDSASLDGNGWMTCTWVMPATLPNNNIADIVAMGVQVSQGASTPNVAGATILMDDLEW